MIPEKGSIRGVARATGHDKDTICRWLDIAGTHSKEVTAYFLRNLNFNTAIPFLVNTIFI